MKLIVAIVNNDDSNVVASALTKENFMVTKLSTTGGFLMVGNTTFLIGTEDDKVERVKEVIRKHSMVRTHQSKTTESFGQGFCRRWGQSRYRKLPFPCPAAHTAPRDGNTA